MFNFLKKKSGDAIIVIFCDKEDIHNILTEINYLKTNYNISVSTLDEEKLVKKLKKVI
ncbi:MAG: hypothetical protein QXG18_02775 [Candidatus Pacearchaeota archaeon]